jgi:hypothetical protein
MMDRLTPVATTLAVLCLGITFPANAESLKEQLVGSWSVVRNCEEFQDGKKNCAPLGENMKGLLMFDANSFSFQMIGGDRAKTADPRTPVGPLVAYFGTYSTNDADKVLTYHMSGLLGPTLRGKIRSE